MIVSGNSGVPLFQKHIGHDKNYGRRKRAPRIVGRPSRNPLGNSLAVSPGMPGPTEQCAAPPVAQHLQGPRLTTRARVSNGSGCFLESLSFKNTLGTTRIMGLDNDCHPKPPQGTPQQGRLGCGCPRSTVAHHCRTLPQGPPTCDSSGALERGPISNVP